jgi:plasmid stabilization system protein ParE
MSVYILSQDADLDLDDIWEYIAQDNIDGADRWIGKLFMRLRPSDRHPASAISAKTSPPIRCCSFRWVLTLSSIAPFAQR